MIQTRLSIAGMLARIAIIGSLALSTAKTLGQSTFGTILGTVHDSSGALIPGCAISIENVGTSSRRSALTDENGSYTMPNLEPGTYKVTMSLTGFQVAEFTAIQLQARQTVRI